MVGSSNDAENLAKLVVLATTSIREELVVLLEDALISFRVQVAPAVPRQASGDSTVIPIVEDVVSSATPDIVILLEVANLDDIQFAKEAIEKTFSIVQESWSQDEGIDKPSLSVISVIPPHTKPSGWSSHTKRLPTTFRLTIGITPDVCIADQSQPTALLPFPENPLALVMKGGGIKGLAYVGAIEQLREHYGFNWFVGTSAGAIAAILLGAGYSTDELKAILQNKNFNDFFDAKWYQMPFNLIFHRGLHRADTFTRWLDELLAAKLKRHDRVKLSDLPYRVTVYASQRGTTAVEFDSIENENVHAAYAARCSMSIPLLFTPESNQGIRTYDGGIQHNYPIDQLLNEHPGTEFISLYLAQEIYEPVKSKSVLADILSIVTEASDADAIEKYRASTIIIDPRPIGTLDFDLTSDEKQFLLSAGESAAVGHLFPDSDVHKMAINRRDALKRTVEKSRSEIKCQRKKKRRIHLLFVLLALVALGWWFWPRAADPTVPVLLASSGVEISEWMNRSFDASMPGIVVHRRTVDIDLSNEVPVPPELRDTTKTSPSIHSFKIEAERINDNAEFVVNEFASQRRQMEISCISNHPYAVWFRRDASPVGEGFNNVWTIVIDVMQHSRDIPFTALFRVTRYNAYQAENKNFVGHLVAGNEEEIVATVRLPRAYSLASPPRLLEKKQGNPEAKWEPFTGDTDVAVRDNGTSFEWVLRKPNTGWVYAAEIDWITP